MNARAWLLLVALAIAAGCSQRVEVPQINAREVAACALAEYDTNKDGYLDAGELQRCPGLQSALKRFDRDKDGRFSQSELEAYFATYVDSKIGLQALSCRFTLDDQPLVGATVVLEPESFMGRNIKPARGVTNERGNAGIQIDGAAYPGCNLAVYRVRVSRKVNDQETLPARYNTQTQLGLEVAPGLRGRTAFHLQSR
jgi:hypothetical protein